MRQEKTNYTVLAILALVTIFCGALYLKSSVEQTIYDNSKPVARAKIGDTTLSVPSWSLFHDGQMWSLVSPTSTLSPEYIPTLSDVSVSRTSSAEKVSTKIIQPLESLFAQATMDGVHLMLSSAYRSAVDQQTLHDVLLSLQGQAYVQQYVAAPGASEHQTGLAVDIATLSSACGLDANACSLNAAGIAWLRAHAADYGFIERYPSGKQSITGVAGEHWHYRYVGVPLAKALTSAGMTLDEFVQQVALGYAK